MTSSKIVFRFLQDLPPPKPREEIVEGLIGRGEIALLTGAPKMGKSSLACALVASITNGENFLGRTTSKGAAVYLAAERGEGVQRRLDAAGADPAKAAIAMTSINLLDDVGDLIQAIRSLITDPALIVIDTLARVTLGIEENSARDMGRVVAALTRVQDAFPRAALVVVHHTGKAAGASARGSGALLGGVDLELRVERNKLTVTAANNIEFGQVLPFALETVPHHDGTAEAIVRAASSAARTPAPLQKRNKARQGEVQRWLGFLAEMKSTGLSIEAMKGRLENEGFFKDCTSTASKRVRLDRYLEKLETFERAQGEHHDTGTLVTHGKPLRLFADAEHPEQTATVEEQTEQFHRMSTS